MELSPTDPLQSPDLPPHLPLDAVLHQGYNGAAPESGKTLAPLHTPSSRKDESMRGTNSTLTQERLRQALGYCWASGHFFHRRAAGGRKAGEIAGHINADGYITLSVDGKKYQAHRLVFLYIYGSWPPEDVDHKNLVRTFNALDNLRAATRAENNQNITSAMRHNKTSGLLGVSYCKESGLWRAQIKVGGKKKSIGRYTTPEVAHQAYLAKKRELHSFCTI